MEQDQGLKKTMGLFTALSIVVGIVIGGGVFFKPEAIYTATNGAPGLGIVAWIIGGIITLSAGLTVAEAAASITETGGMMIYIREMWGEKLSFLTGWMQVVLYYPGTVAALAVMFSEQFCQMIGDNSLRAVIAVMMIAIVTILNLLDAKFGSLVQSISTACKVVPIVILIVFGLIKGTGTNPILSPMLGNGVSFGVAFGQVLIATLFVYDGWINIGSIAGELKNPGKDLPKAIIGGISIVMALYIAINLAYLWVLPANELAKVSVPAALVADKIFGSMGGEIISIGILIAAFGSLNGYLLTGPRVVFALSKKGYLPFSKSLKKINQGGSPINAIILTAVIGAIYAATGQFNLISNLEIFTVWIFYVLTFIGIFKLRFTRPNMERPYKVLGYPVIPAIAIAGGIFVLINQLFMAGLNSSLIAIGGILITLLGLPVHRYMVKKEKIKNEHKNAS